MALTDAALNGSRRMHESVSQGSGCLNTSALVSRLVEVLEHEALRQGTKTFSGRRTHRVGENNG